MNREERRKAGIKTKEPIINIKVSDIEAIKEEAVSKGCKRAFLLMLVIPTMIIHDKYHEIMKRTVDGQSREQRFVNLALELYDTYDKDYVSLDDLKQCLFEEAGIDIKGI